MISRLFRHPHLRAWILWGLVFALPICGVSGVLAQWLGAQHYHRALSADAGTAIHPHTHAGLMRHHHRAADPSRVALGTDADLPGAEAVPAAASLMPLVTLTAAPLLVLQAGLRHARPHAPVQWPKGRETEPLDRPPDLR